MKLRPHWNLKTFCIFVLLLGCATGEYGRRYLQRVREEGAMKMLRAGGAQLRYDGYRDRKDGKRVTNVYIYRPVDEEAIKYLKDLPELTVLHFQCAKASQEGLRHLEGHRKLTELRIAHFPVKDEMLKAVSRLRRLKSLSIHDASVSADGIQHLARLPCLERLTLSSVAPNSLGNDALHALGRLDHLTYLECSLHQADDDGVDELLNLKELKELVLLDSKTTPAVGDLLKKSPMLMKIRLGEPETRGRHSLKDADANGIWAAKHKGSTIFERDESGGDFVELSNEQIARRGSW